MKHRKLFPTSTLTNQTDCPDPCDPATCLYGCYPYTDYYLPPSSPSISTGQGHKFSPYLIIVVSFLAIFFLLLGYYIVMVRYRSGRNQFRTPTPQSDGHDQEFLNENQGPAIDHPIWNIHTIGLQPSVIKSITVFKYKKSEQLIEGSECSVCLSEFQEDETLRLLPKCNHAFHIPCIDTWLRSHTNCPLCRAGILSNTSCASSALIPNDQNSFDLNPEEETQIGNLQGDGELDQNCVSYSETRDETEGEVELPHVDDEEKESVNPNGISVFSVIDSLEDEKMVMEGEIQPMRRSISMNSPSSSTVTNFCMAESGGNSVNYREYFEKSDSGKPRIQDSTDWTVNKMMVSLSIAQSQHKSPALLKRSFSYGGRLFFPRHGRSSSSVLPQ